MRSKLETMCLFFPEPFALVDYANLDTCGVRRLQMFVGTASDPRQTDQLKWLARNGVAVTLRIEEPNLGEERGSYYDPLARGNIIARVRYVQTLVSVEAVIVGNEPEHQYDLSWRSQNWGNTPDLFFPEQGGKAQAHNDALLAMIPLLRGLGVRVVSPGWTHRRVRPQQEAQPGRMSWRELCLPAYNACDRNGSHIYADSMASAADDERYLDEVGDEAGRCHRGIDLNETNIGTRSVTPVERMAALLEMYRLIAQSPDAGRFETFCFFCSNGRPDENWAHMIIRDPASYGMLADWMGA